MNRDKAKVILYDAIFEAFDEHELENNRSGYIGDKTIDLMAEAALNVLLAVEDSYKYMKDEEVLK